MKIGLTVGLYPLAKVSIGSISIDLRTMDIISNKELQKDDRKRIVSAMGYHINFGVQESSQSGNPY